MAFTKITAAGIGSTETVTLDGLSVINNGSFGGNLTVGGVLTYEDVTNVDSVGLITARNGIVVGSGITLSKDGDGFFTGVVTATSYAGDGSGLTGVASTENIITNTNATFLQNINVGFPVTIAFDPPPVFVSIAPVPTAVLLVPVVFAGKAVLPIFTFVSVNPIPNLPAVIATPTFIFCRNVAFVFVLMFSVPATPVRP